MIKRKQISAFIITVNSFVLNIFIAVVTNFNSVRSETKYFTKMAQTSQNGSKKSIKRLVRSDENMFSSFRPIFCFSRIFGSMPFSIVCNSNGEVQSCEVKVVDYVWFVISIGIYLRLMIFNYSLWNLYADYQREGTIFVLFVGNFILQWLGFIFGVLSFAINSWNRYMFLDFLKMFEHFDKEVS